MKKNLISLIAIILSFNINAQVLVIDIQEPIEIVRFRKIDCSCDSCFTENWRLRITESLLSIDFAEDQIYHVTLNDLDIVLKMHYLDDVLMSLNDLDIVCNCTYKIENNQLIISKI